MADIFENITLFAKENENNNANEKINCSFLGKFDYMIDYRWNLYKQFYPTHTMRLGIDVQGMDEEEL